MQQQQRTEVVPRFAAVRAAACIACVACAACVDAGGEDPEREIEYVAGWSCGGTVGTTANPAGVYYTTTFGCWTDESGGSHSDSGDNCIPYCTGRAGWEELCGGLSGRECEESVNWFTADSDRFGCFTRLRVENPDTGRAAVLVVLDRGPACFVERNVSHWVLDMSYPASEYLFGGPTSAGERADVRVEVVDADTPLGPVMGDPDPGDPGDPPADPAEPDPPTGDTSCEGYCPGGAETFCATWNDDGGHCVPRTFDGDCSAWAGTSPRLVERFVGDSGVPGALATVCVPDDVAGVSCSADGDPGECIDTSILSCDGTQHTGACPGPTAIRCCT